MIREMDRELKVSGITVPVNHYQNQELSGDDRLTKELIGVSFVISKPYLGKREMLDFMFKDEAELIEKYCRAELSDRLDRNGVNPGKSWEIRQDLWQKLVSKTRQEGRFDYTYSERLHIFHKGPEIHQLDNVIMTLRDDPHSRRAMVMIFEPEDTRATAGALTRVPCSVSYQFLIRNNRLHVIYYIRSNDFFKHFAIEDVYKRQADHNLDLAKHEFKEPELLTTEELAQIFEQAPMLQEWVNACLLYTSTQSPYSSLR